MLVILAGAAHFLAVAASHFSPEAARTLIFSFVYLLLGIGILRGWHWSGYVAFVLLVLGLFSASRSIGLDSAIPDWSRQLILAVNFLASVVLGLGLFQKLKSDPDA